MNMSLKMGVFHLLELFKYIPLTCIGVVDEGDDKKSIVIRTAKAS